MVPIFLADLNVSALVVLLSTIFLTGEDPLRIPSYLSGSLLSEESLRRLSPLPPSRENTVMLLLLVDLMIVFFRPVMVTFGGDLLGDRDVLDSSFNPNRLNTLEEICFFTDGTEKYESPSKMLLSTSFKNCYYSWSKANKLVCLILKEHHIIAKNFILDYIVFQDHAKIIK